MDPVFHGAFVGKFNIVKGIDVEKWNIISRNWRKVNYCPIGICISYTRITEF